MKNDDYIIREENIPLFDKLSEHWENLRFNDEVIRGKGHVNAMSLNRYIDSIFTEETGVSVEFFAARPYATSYNYMYKIIDVEKLLEWRMKS